MTKGGKAIGLLALCQGLLLTNNIINISMNGLVGYAFAADKAWATLPLTAFVVGTALSTVPASLWMKRVGRRLGFITGCTFGICGAAINGVAAVETSFWLLVAGNFLTGGYNAFGQYYRFAAAEAVDEYGRSRAIALVLAGGIGGAIFGPESSKFAKDALAVPYLGAYLLLVGCALAALVIQLVLRLPMLESGTHAIEPARPLRRIVAQPRLLVAVLGAAVGYAIMSFLMTSTPLAMVALHHPYATAAFVVEWHVIAMYAPSFVTGSLIRRFGVLTIMGTGAVLMLGTVATAESGTSVPLFWIALVLLGVGWNFLYVGGTTLLTTCYRPSERAKVQGLNDVLVFTSSATASLLSGIFLHIVGWHAMVRGAIPLILLVLAALLWVGWRGGRSGPGSGMARDAEAMSERSLEAAER